jgi:hypothetical protein
MTPEQLAEQRDQLLDFCRVVCPTSDGSFSVWDRQTGTMYRELLKRDRDRLLNLLDEASSYCPVALQDRIRHAISKESHNKNSSRLIEALKAIADPEHCLTGFRVQDLRDIAVAALQEIDRTNDYSSCTGVGDVLAREG